MLRQILLGLALTLAVPALASANEWGASHPRRLVPRSGRMIEVNRRLERQNFRIREGVAGGRLTPWQGRRLHREDHMLRREERVMAAANHGHITRREQRLLNRQENRISRQIYRR